MFCIGLEVCLGRETLLGLRYRLWCTPKQNFRSYTRVPSRLRCLGNPLHLQGEIQPKDVCCCIWSENLHRRVVAQMVKSNSEPSWREQFDEQEKKNNPLNKIPLFFLMMYLKGKPERDCFDCLQFWVFYAHLLNFSHRKMFHFFFCLFFKLLCISPVGPALQAHLTSVCVCIFSVWHLLAQVIRSIWGIGCNPDLL